MMLVGAAEYISAVRGALFFKGQHVCWMSYEIYRRGMAVRQGENCMQPID